ncbi:hypothetical protein PAXINDRAFT_157537 [Paxillus involutus ATCC 200175]|uniref:Uncharacterized protein n=1 Tax=Paxillus involutus ATCC 200175 TaxID=664439 RepID=A0A0C9TSG1_PAXIN|nr:hypothetical protein PAXINDRAFT_157537 [Paxillus involutus ATCC 200175]
MMTFGGGPSYFSSSMAILNRNSEEKPSTCVPPQLSARPQVASSSANNKPATPSPTTGATPVLLGITTPLKPSKSDQIQEVICALKELQATPKCFTGVAEDEYATIMNVITEKSGTIDHRAWLTYFPESGDLIMYSPHPCHEQPTSDLIAALNTCFFSMSYDTQHVKLDIYSNHCFISSKINTVPNLQVHLSAWSQRGRPGPRETLWIGKCGFMQDKAAIMRKMKAAVATEPDLQLGLVILIKEKRQYCAPKPSSSTTQQLHAHPLEDEDTFLPARTDETMFGPVIIGGHVWIDIEFIKWHIWTRYLYAKGTLFPNLEMQGVDTLLLKAIRVIQAKLLAQLRAARPNDDHSELDFSTSVMGWEQSQNAQENPTPELEQIQMEPLWPKKAHVNEVVIASQPVNPFAPPSPEPSQVKHNTSNEEAQDDPGPSVCPTPKLHVANQEDIYGLRESDGGQTTAGVNEDPGDELLSGFDRDALIDNPEEVCFLPRYDGRSDDGATVSWGDMDADMDGLGGADGSGEEMTIDEPDGPYHNDNNNNNYQDSDDSSRCAMLQALGCFSELESDEAIPVAPKHQMPPHRPNQHTQLLNKPTANHKAHRASLPQPSHHHVQSVVPGPSKSAKAIRKSSHPAAMTIQAPRVVPSKSNPVKMARKLSHPAATTKKTGGSKAPKPVRLNEIRKHSRMDARPVPDVEDEDDNEEEDNNKEKDNNEAEVEAEADDDSNENTCKAINKEATKLQFYQDPWKTVLLCA